MVSNERTAWATRRPRKGRAGHPTSERPKLSSRLAKRAGRVDYYARSIAADILPSVLFRGRLGRHFDRIAAFDPAFLAERVGYYNKLTRPTEATFDATVGSIPMAKSFYYYDLKEIARYFPRSLRLRPLFGDIVQVPDQPSLLKSRPIHGDNRRSVVMKLEKHRHFVFPADPVPFADKLPLAVWRGGPHNAKRRALIASHGSHPLCDVGVTAGDGGPRKPFLTPDEQKAYRYIISIEGNDVATNLKWILASNSLCIMPAPLYETWFMEGRLVPGVHYAQVRDDFADLEETILRFERHPEDARAIIAAANDYVRPFRDADSERLLSLLVLHKYFVVTGQSEPDPRAAPIIGV